MKNDPKKRTRRETPMTPQDSVIPGTNEASPARLDGTAEAGDDSGTQDDEVCLPSPDHDPFLYLSRLHWNIPEEFTQLELDTARRYCGNAAPHPLLAKRVLAVLFHRKTLKRPIDGISLVKALLQEPDALLTPQGHELRDRIAAEASRRPAPRRTSEHRRNDSRLMALLNSVLPDNEFYSYKAILQTFNISDPTEALRMRLYRLRSKKSAPEDAFRKEGKAVLFNVLHPMVRVALLDHDSKGRK
ncbi:MAG: hypothetical protein GX580_13970 [Candidatus Hydrogenedens sp.]|nr:hypothetical protein [Candidatus Hydrogenedens sp.]